MNQSQLEGALADYFDRDHCILLGRGTTAIALAVEALAPHKKIILPSFMTPAVAYGIKHGRGEPHFCQVRGTDFTLDPEALEEQIDADTGAVIAAHPLGHPAEMDTIGKICESYGVPLIEDFAEAIGTTYNGVNVGAFGDISLTSFNHNKTIDLGTGGALFTDSSDLAQQLRTRASELPSKANQRRCNLLRKAISPYFKIWLSERPILQPVKHRLPTFLLSMYLKASRNCWVHSFNTEKNQELEKQLNNIEKRVSQQKEKASMYRDLLDHPDITHPHPAGDPAYFMYGITFDSRRTQQRIQNVLEEHNHPFYPAFPPVHLLFGNNHSFPQAQSLWRQMVWLPVDPDTSENDIRQCCNEIQRTLDAAENADS